VAYFRQCGCVGVAILTVATAAAGGEDDELKPFLKKVVAAVGGGQATGVKAWTQTSRLNAINVKGSVIYRDFVELPDRFRRETEFEGGTLMKRTTFVILGDKGWGKTDERIWAGEVDRLNPDEIGMIKWVILNRGGAVPLIPLLPGVKASPLGESKIGDRVVVGVRAVHTVPAGWEARLYYDKESARLVRYEMVGPGREVDTFAYSYEGGKTVARRQGVGPATDRVDPNLEWEVIEFKLADTLDRKLFEPFSPPPRTAETVAVEWVKGRGRASRADGSVVGVSLIYAAVTDAELKELAPLKDLRKLALQGNPEITGAGLKHLAPLEKLEELDLGRTRVGDAGLKELAPFQELRSLNLWIALVTDAGLKNLAPLKELQSLNLSNNQVTDAGLKELAPFEDLRSLDLSGTTVTDAGLKEVARHKGLQSLGLMDTRVTDAGLSALAPLESLRELNLSRTRVTDLGLEEVARHKSLQSLNLRETAVTDAGLAGLAPLKDLRLLDLSLTRLTDAALKEVARHENLQTLFLVGPPVTDAALKELAPLTDLRDLHVGSQNVTVAGLKELARFKKLERLTLTGSPVTEAGRAALQDALPRCLIIP
jgi:internalin A